MNAMVIASFSLMCSYNKEGGNGEILLGHLYFFLTCGSSLLQWAKKLMELNTRSSGKGKPLLMVWGVFIAHHIVGVANSHKFESSYHMIGTIADVEGLWYFSRRIMYTIFSL